MVIHTFELSHQWRASGELSDLLDAFRQLCEATLDHPSLARPLAFGSEGDIPYVVYSDLAGTAMDVVMQQGGARPVAEVLQRTRQLADAIDFAAKAGVHHGMMAPADVILDGERTGVTGFGLAQALVKAGVPAAAASPYGSPQRLAGAPPTRIDDIYSLAAITLELLIGTRSDQDLDTSRALRESQGLPERRRIPRPAPHETRMFTTIAGVDAGKLRACFAAAFAEESSERPSTGAEFVASFESAFFNGRGTNEAAAPRLAVVPSVHDEHEDPPSAPVMDVQRAEEGKTLALPCHKESVVAERRETLVMSQPLAWRSRALVIAMIVAISATAGFSGGFVVGQRSRPSTESTAVSHRESVAEPQPAQRAIQDPPPTASITVAPDAVRERASGPQTIEVSHRGHDPQEKQVTLSEHVDLRPTSVPADTVVATKATGSLQVTSRPSGAQVFVDDTLIGTAPLLLSDVAVGSRRLRLELSGYQAFTTSVEIKPGARSRLAARLEP